MIDSNDTRSADPIHSNAPRPSAHAAVLLYALAAVLLFFTRQYVSVRADVLPLWQLAQEVVFFGLPWAAYYQLRPQAKPAARLTNAPSVGACVITALTAIVGLEYFSGLDALWLTVLTRLGINLNTLGQWLATDSDAGLFTALLTVAAPALFEELSFRGLLLPSLERYGPGRAVILSGTLFALTHMSLPGLPTHLLLGIALSMLAVASDSLVVPMIYHFAHNAAAVAISYLVRVDEGLALRELVSRDMTRTIVIQTAIAFVLWALMLRSALLRSSVSRRGVKVTAASGETLTVVPDIPAKRERFPKSLAVIIAILTLGLLSIYALQWLALTQR